ncbi:putative ankyrin repeat protein RBE_0317 [Sitodiplosis mosellana]|uniref:putative ankyrin repeat protein RBE_0317 n=1 Tax=Sitodiplosis mosellana TaxID=263140 RepID=UPI002444FF35|nr:putative ankyrin repeat protein RBE_0317 [Sitodiplosis mosellana]
MPIEPKPLHAAVLDGHEDIAEDLIKNGVHLNIKNNDENTVLHLAVAEDVDVENKDGDTALHIAVEKGYKKIVRKLLRYANVNVQNSNGDTPLFYAVDGCQGEIFRELLKVDEINVNIKNNDKETVLFRAVENC